MECEWRGSNTCQQAPLRAVNLSDRPRPQHEQVVNERPASGGQDGPAGQHQQAREPGPVSCPEPKSGLLPGLESGPRPTAGREASDQGRAASEPVLGLLPLDQESSSADWLAVISSHCDAFKLGMPRNG